MKVLVTGASGLLGSNLCKVAVSRYQVVGVYHTHKILMKGVEFVQADLTRPEDIIKIKKVKPDCIVHCAALTNVDTCESFPDEAMKQNVVASQHIARVAQELGIYLIHISTDGLFDGQKGNYREDDPVRPLNVYAESKYLAEQTVSKICPSAMVVRTNIFGWNKIEKFSLAEWMLDKLIRHQPLPGFNDVIFSPIFVNDLAEVLLKLIHIREKGVMHIAGQEACSKFDFAHRIARIFGLDEQYINPVNVSDLALKAVRPKNTSLNVARVQQILGIRLPGLTDGLERMKALKDRGYLQELKYE